MERAIRKHIGMLIGYKSGVPIYAFTCPVRSDGLERHLGVLLGYKSGVPVYGFTSCLPTYYDVVPALLAGFKTFKPVYLYTKDCCEQGEGGGLGSSSQEPLAVGSSVAPRQCDAITFPTLTATVTAAAGGLAGELGNEYPLTQWDGGNPNAWISGDGGSGAFIIAPGLADFALCVTCDDACNMTASLDSATVCAGDVAQGFSGDICSGPVVIVVSFDNGFGDTIEFTITE